MAQNLYHNSVANEDALSVLAVSYFTGSIAPKYIEREAENTAL